MGTDAGQAKCRSCGYTEDCEDVRGSSSYECEYCGESNWNTTDCD